MLFKIKRILQEDDRLVDLNIQILDLYLRKLRFTTKVISKGYMCSLYITVIPEMKSINIDAFDEKLAIHQFSTRFPFHNFDEDKIRKIIDLFINTF